MGLVPLDRETGIALKNINKKEETVEEEVKVELPLEKPKNTVNKNKKTK